MGTIIERETEEEVTECNPSFAQSEDSYNIRIEERHSTVYSMNMGGMKDRNTEMKNKFGEKNPRLEGITEESEIPEEQSVGNYRSLDAPDLIPRKKDLDTGGPRASECYCCFIRG